MDLHRRSLFRGALAGAGALLAQRKARAQAATAMQKTVYAWYPSRFGTWNTAGIQWDAITHICFRTLDLQADGTVGKPAGNPPAAFVDEAHAHGVKVCVLAWSTSQRNTDSYLANHASETVQGLLSYVRENRLDGISYDDETIRAINSVTSGASGPLVTEFFKILYQEFKSANSDYHVSFAAPPVISANDRFGSTWFDWASIAGSVDAIVPMLYTANPASIGWATNAQPLAGSKQTGATVPRDVVTLMGDYYTELGDQKSKLLLGMNSFPWAGYEFRTRTADRLSATAGAGKTQAFDYMESQAVTYGKRWDSKQQSAWYVYQDGDQFVQGWYDDDDSWAAKLDYVNQEGLGGVGIWVLDGLNDSPQMFDLLRANFAPLKMVQKTEARP
jgi:spore germination protein